MYLTISVYLAKSACCLFS